MLIYELVTSIHVCMYMTCRAIAVKVKNVTNTSVYSLFVCDLSVKKPLILLIICLWTNRAEC